ncbi:hypothetical protein JCM8097_001743 [Rhodosporidiobolus ruineniae]
MSGLYDLDRDGYPETALYDLDYDGYPESGYYGDLVDPYSSYGYGGADAHLDGGLGYGGGGWGGGWGEGYYPDLWEMTSYLPEYDWDAGYGYGYGAGMGGGVGLYDAWRDETWAEEQYALADLMHFQSHLALDTALSEQERLARWEARLAWEELDDAARHARYHELLRSDPYALENLGLAGGWWGRRFGGRDVDLGYLRQVPLRRGIFAGPYRERFVRHPTLGRRYTPYLSPTRLRGLSLPPGSFPRTFGGAAVPVPPRPAAPYTSQRLSATAGMGVSLRERELLGRLRAAEMRASLSGISPTARAAALSDARRLRAELNLESRTAREIDRAERRSDALLAAREAEAERAEMREEMRELEGIARLEGAAEELVRRPIPGAGLGMEGKSSFYFDVSHC